MSHLHMPRDDLLSQSELLKTIIAPSLARRETRQGFLFFVLMEHKESFFYLLNTKTQRNIFWVRGRFFDPLK